MSKAKYILCALFLLGSNKIRAQTPLYGNVSLPRFEDYPAIPGPSKLPAMPIFNDQDDLETDLRFRQDVTTAALDGPNFAGKFTVAKISCGTGCVYIAVVNEETGRVFSKMPFESLLVGPFKDRSGKTQLGRVAFGIHSRLLVASGWFDSTNGRDEGYCARMYYEWKGDQFRLVRRVALHWR